MDETSSPKPYRPDKFGSLRDAIQEAIFFLSSVAKGIGPGNLSLPECSEGLYAAVYSARSMDLTAADEAARTITGDRPGVWAVGLLGLLNTALEIAPAAYQGAWIRDSEVSRAVKSTVEQLIQRSDLLLDIQSLPGIVPFVANITDVSAANGTTSPDTVGDKPAIKNKRPITTAAADCGRLFREALRRDPKTKRIAIVREYAKKNEDSAASIDRVLSDHPALWEETAKPTEARQTKSP